MFRKVTSPTILVFLLAAVQPCVGADPDPGLMGWWTLDGHALDVSGNDRHGTLNGTPDFEPGVFGDAMLFDGDDYVTIDGYKGIEGTNPWSVTAWIKVTDVPGHMCVINWGTPVNGQRIELRLMSGTGILRANHGAGNVNTNTALNDGEWHHVALTSVENAFCQYPDMILYVDGEDDTVQSTDTDPMLDIVPGADLGIGYRASHQDRYWIGSIDEVRMYDRVLVQEEIQQIMESAGEPYPFASSPEPADGSFMEATWGNLSWRAGVLAASHDVYMGESFADVNDGTGDTFIGNQSNTDIVVGFPGLPFPDGLEPGTTYYWRIDEVNEADPGSPWKGDVWSFSIPPRTAYLPVPADEGEAVALDARLAWSPGFEAKLHTVYFGDNFDDVNNAAGGPLLGDATFTPPGPLELATTYYWRVDEFDPPVTHKGAVWSFTTEGTASDPIPAKGAVDVSPTPLLKWSAANLAGSHEIYFGADADAVASAGKSSPEYKGSQPVGEEVYVADRLELMTTYYWRVDEVNSTEPGSPWRGNVWSFTTGYFLVVDDFEVYNDIDPPDEASNRIFDKWIDGYGTLDNGALVGNALPPYAEQTVVHGGGQSMNYAYDNAGKTSEATLTLTSQRDWTAEGVTKLSLWVRGRFSNAADRIYVAPNGTAVVYHDDPAATQLTGWNEWVIDLATFGIDLTNVDSITIGVGTRNAPAPDGGTGTVYIDDIRLLKPVP